MGLYGGIELGGTKIVCAVGTGPGGIRAETRFPTVGAAEALARIAGFFSSNGPIQAVGVACFGPLDPNPASPTFGYVTTTPKPGWAHTDVVGILRDALGVPVGFDTDVNGAALGEWRWGAAQGLDTFIYLTVGTGIGGGGMANGRMLHGLMHPEMGHLWVPHDRAKDPFAGSCSYHGDCLEGLAAGPAIEARWGQRGEHLPPDHPAWALEAHYLALALVNYILTLSPQRLILGGGVMAQSQLFPLIRAEVQALLKDYLRVEPIQHAIDRYIVPPGLGGRAGVLGALALAERAVAS